MERHQPAEADRLQQTDLIGEVAVAQREQVSIVRAEGCGREPEEECRIQRRQDTAVTLCRRVMELIDHHVIEMAVAKSLKMRRVRHGLHRREHDVTIVLGLAIDDEATGTVRIHACIGFRRLLQQFAPVRDEQHLARVGRIECSEKGLAKPGGRDDQRPPFAIGPQTLKLLQGEGLYGPRFDSTLVGTTRRLCRFDGYDLATSFVGVYPAERERHGVCAAEQVVERGRDLVHRVAGIHVQHRPGPLDPVDQAAAADIRRADERASRTIRTFEHPCFRMERARSLAVDPRFKPDRPSAQRTQRVRLCHAQIVRGQQAQRGTPQLRRAHRALEQADATVHHERHRNPRAHAGAKLVLDRIEQRVAAALMQPLQLLRRIAQHQTRIESAALSVLAPGTVSDVCSRQASIGRDGVDNRLHIGEFFEHGIAISMPECVDRLVRLLQQLQPEQAGEFARVCGARIEEPALQLGNGRDVVSDQFPAARFSHFSLAKPKSLTWFSKSGKCAFRMHYAAEPDYPRSETPQAMKYCQVSSSCEIGGTKITVPSRPRVSSTRYALRRSW